MNAVIARQNGDAGDGGAGAGGGDAATAAAEAGAEARLVFDAAFVVFDSIGCDSSEGPPRFETSLVAQLKKKTFKYNQWLFY